MYEKNIWANGDIITAEKLNHIEDGIANNLLVVRLTVPENDPQHCYSDVTITEIFDAFDNNIPVFGILAYEDGGGENVRMLDYAGIEFHAIWFTGGGRELNVVTAEWDDGGDNEFNLYSYVIPVTPRS